MAMNFLSILVLTQTSCFLSSLGWEEVLEGATDAMGILADTDSNLVLRLVFIIHEIVIIREGEEELVQAQAGLVAFKGVGGSPGERHHEHVNKAFAVEVARGEHLHVVVSEAGEVWAFLENLKDPVLRT